MFHNVSLVSAPFVDSLASSCWDGGVPRLSRLIEKPSATVAATSCAAITFCKVIEPPSFPRIPMQSVANAIRVARGHTPPSLQAPQGQIQFTKSRLTPAPAILVKSAQMQSFWTGVLGCCCNDTIRRNTSNPSNKEELYDRYP